ncbi:MAG: hypothetical protein ACR2QM_06830 [Longimicrobiales bacterium]
MKTGIRTGALVLGFALASATSLTGQSWKTVSAARQVTGEDQVKMKVTYAAGVLKVGPAASGTLYRSRLRYDEDAAIPVHEYENESLHIGIERLETRRVNVKNWTLEGSMDVELPTEVLVDLELELGAVKADLDLTDIPIYALTLRTEASESEVHVDKRNPSEIETARFEIGAADFVLRGLGNLNARQVSVEAGVGSVTLVLDGSWSTSQKLEIDMGLGALELRIPETLGVRLEKSSFLASLDTKGMTARGGAYYSTNWDQAESKVDIEISAALASVDLVWTR